MRGPAGLGEDREALRPVRAALAEEAALGRFVEFTDAWGGKCPATVRLRGAAWAEFVPFLRFDVEIRKTVCAPNAIESVSARIREAVRVRGRFPAGQAALRASDVIFDGRLTAGRR